MHCHGQCVFVFKHPLGSLLVLRLRYPPRLQDPRPTVALLGDRVGSSCNPSAVVGRKDMLQASLQALPATKESLTARRTCRQTCKISVDVLCQLLLRTEAMLQIWSSSGVPAVPLMWLPSRESWHTGVVPCYLWWCMSSLVLLHPEVNLPPWAPHRQSHCRVLLLCHRHYFSSTSSSWRMASPLCHSNLFSPVPHKR